MDKPLDGLHVSCRSKGCPRCNSRSAQTCPAISTMYLYVHVYSRGDNDKSCALSSDQTCSDDPQSAGPCINAARGERSGRSQCTLLGGCCMSLHDAIVVFGKGILRFLAIATQPPKRKSRRQETTLQVVNTSRILLAERAKQDHVDISIPEHKHKDLEA